MSSSKKTPPPPPQQTKEQEIAKENLERLLDRTRPKNLTQGVTSGCNNIIAGGVGGIGILVLAPTTGLLAGAKRGGIVGGGVGLVGGAVVGAVGAAAMIVGGAVQGVIQIGRGFAAVPGQITEPSRGKWWNDNDGRWIETNLDTESSNLQSIPDDDDDILGHHTKHDDNKNNKTSNQKSGQVKDPFYYDALGVDATSDQSQIRRQYYVLARKYHPDRVGSDDAEAADKFKAISEAYQVLSDDALRAKYDEFGREGLSPDKTSGVDGVDGTIEPSLLFAYLFGSDKFEAFVGRLAMATSAMVGDSEEISPKQARTLQRRRCARLAILLAERLESWVKGDEDGAKVLWAAQAEELCGASYGTQMVRLIGDVYTVASVQFLGTIESGIGMPSITKWALARSASMKKSSNRRKQNAQTMKAQIEMQTMSLAAQQKMKTAQTPEEQREIENSLENEMYNPLLQVMWTTTAIDITNTLHETCQMVMFDRAVDKAERKKRAKGIKALGEIFAGFQGGQQHQQESGDGAKRMYEEAAFAAMLETIKRKDEEAHKASFRGATSS